MVLRTAEANLVSAKIYGLLPLLVVTTTKHAVILHRAELANASGVHRMPVIMVLRTAEGSPVLAEKRWLLFAVLVTTTKDPVVLLRAALASDFGESVLY